MKFGQIRGNNFLFLNLLRHSRIDFISSLKYIHHNSYDNKCNTANPNYQQNSNVQNHYHHKPINALYLK